MKRLLFFIAFMTLGTSALIELLGVQPGGTSSTGQPAPAAANMLNMQTVNVHQLLGEQLRWELQAREASYNENANTGRLLHVQFRVYEPPTNETAAQTFSGESGEAFLTGSPNRLVLQGAVVLHRGDDLEIRSERIEFDGAKQVFIAPGPVRVRTPQGVQEGSSLRYDVGEQHLQFENPVFYQ